MVVRLGGGSMGQAGRQSVRIVRWAYGASSQVGTLCQQSGGHTVLAGRWGTQCWQAGTIERG